MKYVVIACVETLEYNESVDFELVVHATDPHADLRVSVLPELEQVVVRGEWNDSTAGGCIHTSAWRLNPQYLLHVKHHPIDLHLFLTQTSDKLNPIALYCIRTGM
jgi:hypothetical protein